MDYIKITNTTTEKISDDIKDWIRLYPNSFDENVIFRLYDCGGKNISVVLDESLSSLAISLLVSYLAYSNKDSVSNVNAFLTLEDREILSKEYLGKRVNVYIEEPLSEYNSVFILTDDGKSFVHTFNAKTKPSDKTKSFEEPEFELPDVSETVTVGEAIVKKTEKPLEPEGLTLEKLKWYLICGGVGLLIGFLIVYLTK